MGNFTLAILVIKKVITADEAELLSKELPLKTQSTRFKDALEVVKKVLSEQ